MYMPTTYGYTVMYALCENISYTCWCVYSGPVQAVICVVPTTILVAQQAAVFRRHINVGVSEFTGSRKVEPWTKERWREEIL